ncbi:MAG: glyoxalase/bleomycin resistance/dioxygenase family protein [Cellvibrionaceae bacterium]|nr:glyoxalase/bleomycin resistance/dioxygenase family protein [Cellvibrionaceae bacterium]|tara:strand:- start:33981 stop:34412 length:432 start_codon:yes stop_codon:yes gene_type:complete
MNPRLTHLALHVEDLDACIDFYRRYCCMNIVHQRQGGSKRIVWLSEDGREQDFVFVVMGGGKTLSLPKQDYRHFGFAVESRQRVDELARLAELDNCLLWAPREEPFPVGYYCGLLDPAGNQVEFSFGQPLGPGAESLADVGKR